MKRRGRREEKRASGSLFLCLKCAEIWCCISLEVKGIWQNIGREKEIEKGMINRVRVERK